MISTLLRTIAVAALAAVATTGLAGSALADQERPVVLGEPTVSDLHLARQATGAPRAQNVLRDLLAQFGDKAPQATEGVAHEPVPVYGLTRDFVAGAEDATVAELTYVAVPEVTTEGTVVTQFVSRDENGAWKAHRASTGDVEARLASQLPAGARLLHEPQVGAWYALEGDQVRLLHATFPEQQPGTTLSLADYQHQVNGAYGDKLPGSDYDRAGAGGGYADEHGQTPLFLAGAALLTVAGCVLAYLRRRRA